MLDQNVKLTLRDVLCVICDEPPDDILLGQKDVLERLTFLQDGPRRLGRIED